MKTDTRIQPCQKTRLVQKNGRDLSVQHHKYYIKPKSNICADKSRTLIVAQNSLLFVLQKKFLICKNSSIRKVSTILGSYICKQNPCNHKGRQEWKVQLMRRPQYAGQCMRKGTLSVSSTHHTCTPFQHLPLYRMTNVCTASFFSPTPIVSPMHNSVNS
jgi:hypothetical protein